MGKSISRGMMATDYLSQYRRNELEHDLREASAARLNRARWTAAIVCGVALGLGGALLSLIIGA